MFTLLRSALMETFAPTQAPQVFFERDFSLGLVKLIFLSDLFFQVDFIEPLELPFLAKGFFLGGFRSRWVALGSLYVWFG